MYIDLRLKNKCQNDYKTTCDDDWNDFDSYSLFLYQKLTARLIFSTFSKKNMVNLISTKFFSAQKVK